MREKKIQIDQVLQLLEEDLSQKSQGLIDIVEKEGSSKIAQLLTQI